MKDSDRVQRLTVDPKVKIGDRLTPRFVVEAGERLTVDPLPAGSGLYVPQPKTTFGRGKPGRRKKRK